MCEDLEKLNVLMRFLGEQGENRGLIFCKTKVATQKLAKQLIARNVPADAIHGDLLQKERDKAMRAFKNKTVRVKQYSIDMINSFDRFEKAANELGVEIPNNLQKKAKEAEDLKKRTTKLQSMISSTLKSL